MAKSTQPIMINGKTVGTIPISKSDVGKNVIMEKAMKMKKVRNIVNGTNSYEIIYVPHRIFNIVTTKKELVKD